MESETHAEIIAEMRKKYSEYFDAADVRFVLCNFAARLEAAHNRELKTKFGNNAAIRNALKIADETACELLKWISNHYQELNCMGGRLRRALESAAKESWRNCDRFGGDACAAGSINAMKVKMRHALTQVELFLSRVEQHGHPTLNPGDRCDACEGVEELRTLVCAALAEEQTNDSELVKLFTESDAVLKPCPFCGAQARLVHFGMEYIVECTFCDVSTVSGGTRERSINIWNTRTDPMDLPKFHEALLKIAHYCDKKEDMDDCGCEDGWILSDIAKVALIRPATVQEVKDGKAKWCSVCDADCPNKGKDLHRMCERFEDARATVVAKGAK